MTNPSFGAGKSSGFIWHLRFVRSFRLGCLDRRDQLGERVLRITEERYRPGVVEELVVDASETRPHRSLHEDDVLGLVHVEDRHPVDRAAWRVSGGGGDDVVGADPEDNLGGLEV